MRKARRITDSLPLIQVSDFCGNQRGQSAKGKELEIGHHKIQLMLFSCF